MSKRMSRRESSGWKKRAINAESQIASMRKRWGTEWPSSTVIHRISVDEVTQAIVETARTLSHAVIVTIQDGKLTFWGDKP